MIPRIAFSTIERLARGFPVLAITGPRQAGKTTLARHAFPHKPYVSLENPDELTYSLDDPKGFLKRFPDGAILDEVQRSPQLLSWIQGIVDERQQMADFILTGSAQFELVQGITQSLAGRVARIELMSLQGAELNDAGLLPADLNDWLIKGGYPTLYKRDVSPSDWLASYVATYIERDVRQLTDVQNLGIFQRFMRLVAGRSGQLLNLSALAADAGISHTTARQWLSVLEASYIVIPLQPFFENINKRLTKTPKVYFLDTGLLCWLLGIHTSMELDTHPLRGAIFETLIISESIKRIRNRAETTRFNFWRDSNGLEVDLMQSWGSTIHLTEIKAGQTIATDWFKSQRKVAELLLAHEANRTIPLTLVFGGQGAQLRQDCNCMGWREWATQI